MRIIAELRSSLPKRIGEACLREGFCAEGAPRSSAVRDCWRRFSGPAQANPADQSLKAWLGAERIQPGFHSEMHQPRIALFIGFFEQVERLLFFAEADVNECQLIGWEVMLCGGLLQITK